MAGGAGNGSHRVYIFRRMLSKHATQLIRSTLRESSGRWGQETFSGDAPTRLSGRPPAANRQLASFA
jgi:hypothetical protein